MAHPAQKRTISQMQHDSIESDDSNDSEPLSKKTKPLPIACETIVVASTSDADFTLVDIYLVKHDDDAQACKFFNEWLGNLTSDGRMTINTMLTNHVATTNDGTFNRKTALAFMEGYYASTYQDQPEELEADKQLLCEMEKLDVGVWKKINTSGGYHTLISEPAIRPTRTRTFEMYF